MMLKMELILSSCVFNAFFISFSCVCWSLRAFRMLFLKSSMTFIMLVWGESIVGLGFCLTGAAMFVACGLVSFILVPCFTMSANFSSGTYLRLILAILSVFVVFALVIFSLIFLRNSTSFGHPLYDAGCPKFLQFMQ